MGLVLGVVTTGHDSQHKVCMTQHAIFGVIHPEFLSYSIKLVSLPT